MSRRRHCIFVPKHNNVRYKPTARKQLIKLHMGMFWHRAARTQLLSESLPLFGRFLVTLHKVLMLKNERDLLVCAKTEIWNCLRRVSLLDGTFHFSSLVDTEMIKVAADFSYGSSTFTATGLKEHRLGNQTYRDSLFHPSENDTFSLSWLYSFPL